MSYPFHTIAIGGTFDRLHNGHKHILQQAFLLGELVVIGVTSDTLANSKLKLQNPRAQAKIQKFGARMRDLEDFLKKENLLERVKIVEIHDVFGRLERNTDVRAIVVTRETRVGADTINAMRKQKGLPELVVKEVPMLASQDGEKISSTRIREGEIDRLGRNFKSQISNLKSPISKMFREQLKKPQGTLIKGELHDKGFWEKTLLPILDDSFVICVGDEVTRMANMINLPVQIAVFDYHIQRKKIFSKIEDLGFKNHIAFNINHVTNPAGQITPQIVDILDKSIKNVIVTRKKQLIIVDGEEDLAAVPAILFAPLGAKVLYGQPNEGVVVIDVTEERKDSIVGMLE